MKFRSILIPFFLLIFALNVDAQILVLFHADGTTTDVELYTLPKIKFQDEKVLITSAVLDIEYPKEDVLRFTYKGSSTSIKEVNTNSNISQENGQLVFHGISSTDKIAIYTVKGIRVPVEFKKSDTIATLSLSAIPVGVYLLNINGRTSKFTKR